ncbi:Di-copper centre-containing protein [Coprinellus micaceus]|uniref:Di-copper centre-containing protein n=1 Tax=Coprinellus micaceus TaxID=71717 RepID=A0A4Y7SEM1_COPMI|nr:Di-copper centre-containing protein [Coprinellus micaceus]
MLSRAFLPLLFLVWLLAVAYGSPAADPHPGPRKCAKVRLRREWRDLRVTDKHAFIRAVRCLQSLPAKDTSLPKKITRYEEFVVSHTAVGDAIHGVGQFLPWHRHFVFLYETALREECGYQGPFPFWDWPRDADGIKPLKESPLFDPVTGFGPDGTPGTFTMLPNSDPHVPGSNAFLPPFTSLPWGCVTSGPFANLTLHLGPGRTQNFDHCLTRAIQESLRDLLKTSNINKILAQKDYDSFWNSLDGRPFKVEWALHEGGHVGINGDMTNYYTSPNEPLFYLHHSGLDRLWWKWQHGRPGRLREVGGRSSTLPPFGKVTHSFEISFEDLSPNVTVGEAMDTACEPYCYAYSY